MADFKVDIDLSGVKAKLSEDGFKKGQRALANQVLADSTPIVPRRTNNLRNSGFISMDSKEIIWNAPYALKLFKAPKSWHWSTPGTGPDWVGTAKDKYMDSWTRVFIKGAKL